MGPKLLCCVLFRSYVMRHFVYVFISTVYILYIWDRRSSQIRNAVYSFNHGLATWISKGCFVKSVNEYVFESVLGYSYSWLLAGCLFIALHTVLKSPKRTVKSYQTVFFGLSTVCSLLYTVRTDSIFLNRMKNPILKCSYSQKRKAPNIFTFFSWGQLFKSRLTLTQG